MRVALAIQHFPPYHGGAEQQARMLARRLGDALEACDVVTSRHAAELDVVSQEGSTRVLRLPTLGPPAIRRAINGVVAFGYFLLRGGRYDVVHAHCLSPFSLGAILGARLRGARTVLKVCTLGERGDIAKVRRGVAGAWLWRGFTRADRWIATSHLGRVETEGHLRGAQRVAVMTNAVEIPTLAARRDEAGLASARRALGLDERPTCLFVGRLVPGKGLDVIQEAWPAIHDATGASLAIVGEGPLAAELEAWRKSSPAARAVRLIAWQRDPSSYYAASDVLLFPSSGESFGNVLAEAMAHGLAVVTTPVGLAAEHARHRDNAWVLSGDPDGAALAAALRHAVIELLRDPPLRRALGEGARATALASFASEGVVSAYLALYRELVTPTRAAQPVSPAGSGTPSLETDHA